MANEITVSASLSITNGNYTDQIRKLNQLVSQTATTGLGNGGCATVPTTAGGTAIPLGSVATIGWIAVTNLDSTNYMTLGQVVSATYYPFARILPGETVVLRLDQSITPYWLANTSAVQAQYLLVAN